MDHNRCISIHAPAWGATCAFLLHQTLFNNFNPRTRVGCDHRVQECGILELIISIHAPAWGATPYRVLGRATCNYFNPRTRVGCDKREFSNSCAAEISIHAPAWGATAWHNDGKPNGRISIHAPAWGATYECKLPGTTPIYFNPRTRVGCDSDKPIERTSIKISIHAPAWGATCNDTVSHGASRFQSTHPRGVRQVIGHYCWLHSPISIHAPAWGATC